MHRFRRPAGVVSQGVCSLMVAMSFSGCYEFIPMRPAASPTGSPVTVELTLNDRGRADLADRVGPDALALEGRLVNRNDSSYTITVQSVSYYNRSSSKWTGERLTLATGQLRDVREKRLSRGKTGLAIASGLGALVTFVVTRSILIGGETSTPPGGGPPVDQ